MYRGPWEFKKGIHPRTRLLAKISQRECLRQHLRGVHKTDCSRQRQRKNIPGRKSHVCKSWRKRNRVLWARSVHRVRIQCGLGPQLRGRAPEAELAGVWALSSGWWEPKASLPSP